MCGGHCSPRFEGAGGTNLTVPRGKRDFLVAPFLLLTYLVVTASTAQLCLTTQDEISKRKLREAQETRERFRAATQESKQVVGKKDHRNKNLPPTFTPAVVERELEPLKRPPTGGWPMRVSDCPHAIESRAYRENAYLEWITFLSCGAHWSRTPGADDTEMKKGTANGTASVGALMSWMWKDDAVGSHCANTTSRTGVPAGATPVSFVFWNHGSESPQSNRPDVSRSTAEDHGVQRSQNVAGHDAEDMNNPELPQRARLWNHKASVNDALWEAAVRHFGDVSVSSCFLMEVDKGCPQPPVFGDSVFGEYNGTLVQDAGWCLGTRDRCRVDLLEFMVEFVMRR